MSLPSLSLKSRGRGWRGGAAKLPITMGSIHLPWAHSTLWATTLCKQWLKCGHLGTPESGRKNRCVHVIMGWTMWHSLHCDLQQNTISWCQCNSWQGDNCDSRGVYASSRSTEKGGERVSSEGLKPTKNFGECWEIEKERGRKGLLRKMFMIKKFILC
jgi:hypothetical protein